MSTVLQIHLKNIKESTGNLTGTHAHHQAVLLNQSEQHVSPPATIKDRRLKWSVETSSHAFKWIRLDYYRLASFTFPQICMTGMSQRTFPVAPSEPRLAKAFLQILLVFRRFRYYGIYWLIRTLFQWCSSSFICSSPEKVKEVTTNIPGKDKIASTNLDCGAS